MRAGEPLLVLISGGADSACLLEVCLRLGARVSALHVNYGLREGAGGDEALCRELCERLGTELEVERVSLAAAAQSAAGNLQAEARDARYGLAEALVDRSGGDYAAGHTASDQVETVLYRLAVSPGRRALLGMEPRRGRLVRPLLAVGRNETQGYCRARGLAWREDPSNADRHFARARIREDVVPALRSLSPAVERTITETAATLRDEAEVLEAAVDEELARLGPPPVALARVRALAPGLARLVLRRLAEGAAGESRSLSRAEADGLLALGERGGTRSLELGGGLRALVEYDALRFSLDRAGVPPEPATFVVPGVVHFGSWRVEASEGDDREGEAIGVEAAVRAERGEELRVRPWRDGDRIRLAGLGGSRSLADLFTDLKVPRELRRTLPVIESRGEIVWVAGATAEGALWARAADRAPSGREDGVVVRLAARRLGG